MNYYISVQGGTGLNLALASFITYAKKHWPGNKFYVSSPYYDIFQVCEAVDGVYLPQELKDMVLDACADPESTIIVQRLYDLDEFIKKRYSYAQAWAKLMNLPYEEDESKGSHVVSILNPLAKFPTIQKNIDSIKPKEPYIVVQFTGGQSPLVKVPAKLDQQGRPIPNEPDWEKIPYQYDNEPLKRHYPIEKAQKFCDLYHEKHPDHKILVYQLPNEPCPKGDYIITKAIPYLAWYEICKTAEKVVCIDSSLQHLIAGMENVTVLWGHSKPENFGYCCNNNIIQRCRTDNLFYFTALGPSGAKVDYIEPEKLLEEIDK